MRGQSMASFASRLLFIDAYDSFSENIISLLRDQLDVSVFAIKIDCDVKAEYGINKDAFFLQFDAIVLGPGPGNPLNDADVGLYSTVWDIAAKHRIPVLGICLGFQSLCLTYGMSINRLEIPCHGHAKTICHDDGDIFKASGVVSATCYNSLGVKALESIWTPPISRPASRGSDNSSPPMSSRTSIDLDRHKTQLQEAFELQSLAWDQDGWLQGVRHRSLPLWGLQFHPESCKSNDACHIIIRKWWQEVRNEKLHTPIELSSALDGTGDIENALPPRVVRQELLQRLLCLTPVAPEVCFQKTHVSLDRRRMAEFCYQLSNHERISMLESSKKGRYSIYAVTDDKTWTLEYDHEQCKVIVDAATEKVALALADAMVLVEELLAFRLILRGPQDCPFWGGLIGYFSYELGLDLLRIRDPLKNAPAREVPDYSLMWVDRSIVVDKLEGNVYIQSLRPQDQDWVMSTTNSLKTLRASPVVPVNPPRVAVTHLSLPSHQTYTSQIDTCLDQLHEGNSYELCLTTSTPLDLPSSTEPFQIHQQLLQSNPSTYSALLVHPSVTVLSSSPEQFLSWLRPSLSTPGTTLNMQPMKGTLAKYPGLTPVMASKLLRTPKEEAENLMIVDLIRHDLARALTVGITDPISTTTSSAKITVPKLFELVEAETVYQLISHIQATVPASCPPPPPPTQNPGMDSFNTNATITSSAASLTFTNPLHHYKRTTLSHACSALRHTLPPGSMTGAPKKRSCEILRSLEQRNRGVYAGVIGYFDVGGGGAWSVAIRCAFSANQQRSAAAAVGADAAQETSKKKNKHGKAQDLPQQMTRTWHVGAGGAITVLSDRESEWEEMRVKMESVLRGFS